MLLRMLELEVEAETIAVAVQNMNCQHSFMVFVPHIRPS